jgi:hypothetical protein
MTANKFYTPAFVGGRIQAVQLIIQNTTDADITADYQNGIYYCYQGNDFILLSAEDRVIPAGSTITIMAQLYNVAVPTSDIVLMVNTAGLAGCVISALVFWGVE